MCGECPIHLWVMSASTFNMSSRWMDIIPVTDVAPDHAGCKYRPVRGSTHKGVWHTSAPADTSPAFGADGMHVDVCGRCQAALG